MRSRRTMAALSPRLLIGRETSALETLAYLGISREDIIQIGISSWVEWRNQFSSGHIFDITASQLFFDRLYQSVILSCTWCCFSDLIDDLSDLCQTLCHQLKVWTEYFGLEESSIDTIEVESIDGEAVVVGYQF